MADAARKQVDEYVNQLYECKALSEAQVKDLCEKVCSWGGRASPFCLCGGPFFFFSPRASPPRLRGAASGAPLFAREAQRQRGAAVRGAT